MSKFDYVIVDVESYIHKACCACKQLTQLTDNKGKPQGVFQELYVLKGGADYLDKVLSEFKEKFWCKNLVLVIGDGQRNFRKELNTLYKSHRTAKPLMYDYLLQYLQEKYHTVMLPTLEADDTARIVYEDDENFKGEKVIVTIDKDFFSVPCNLYRDNPKDREVVTVSEDDARMNEYVQIIMGDKTDGYFGVAGYGEAKAKKFVTVDTTLEDIEQLFIDNGLTKADFETNKAMAHIVGYKEYDFVNNTVIQKGIL